MPTRQISNQELWDRPFTFVDTRECTVVWHSSRVMTTIELIAFWVFNVIAASMTTAVIHLIFFIDFLIFRFIIWHSPTKTPQFSNISQNNNPHIESQALTTIHWNQWNLACLYLTCGINVSNYNLTKQEFWWTTNWTSTGR